MDPPLLTLSVVAVVFGFCSVIVESQRSLNRPPPQPVFPQPPPPRPESPPPPSPTPHPASRSPPLSPRHPLRSPPPHRNSPFHRSPPPRRRQDPHIKSPPTRRKPKLNAGKKIGLVFIGVVAVLQACVVGFLLISRRQFLKHKNGH